jgi:hypothetical protein
MTTANTNTTVSTAPAAPAVPGLFKTIKRSVTRSLSVIDQASSALEDAVIGVGYSAKQYKLEAYRDMAKELECSNADGTVDADKLRALVEEEASIRALFSR